ncbi:hypothetical protein O3P69_014323 [Scylla paramamosain]|uniref:Uncharacterized protein n=1 Tax=Scylla paramamosain TaxID=85552 RepID=A0AAW0TDW7_SCYPA
MTQSLDPLLLRRPPPRVLHNGKQFAYYETLYGTLLFVRNGESKILCLSPDTLCPVEQASTHMNMRENRLYAFPHSPLKVGYSLLEFVFWYQFFNSVHDRFVVFALVRPHLKYANHIRCPYVVKDIEAVENVQLVPHLGDMTYKDRLRRPNLPTLAYRRAQDDQI